MTRVSTVIAAGLCALLAAACATQAPERAPASIAPEAEPPRLDLPEEVTADPLMAIEQEPIRIGLLLPLSGPAADVGAALRDAAALALFDAYDPRLRLVPFDTRGTADGARTAAQAAVEDGVALVLGPLLSSSIVAAAPVVDAAGLSLIGFSNDRRAARPGAYIMGFMPDQEVERIVDYAVANGHRDFAALVPETPYGERVMATFGGAVRASGGEVTTVHRYQPEADAMSATVRRLARYAERRRAYEAEIAVLEQLGDDLSADILEALETEEALGELGFDALLVAEGDPLLRTLGPLLPYYEIDPEQVQYLGTGLWDEPALQREPALRGAWFPAPSPERPRAFLDRFERVYGRAPPRIATLAYDAMSLAALLARNPLKEDRFSRATLTDAAGYAGVDGAFRFLPGGVAERRLAVLEIARGGFRVVDPAPTSFMETLAGRAGY